MSKWIEYKSTDAQIEEILYAGGYIIRTNTGYESGIRMAVGKRDELISELNDGNVTHYLICQKHPLANMIERWARTGQPVYFKYQLSDEYGNCIPDEYEYGETTNPDWGHPNTEYSFEPFEEEKVLFMPVDKSLVEYCRNKEK